MGLIELNNYLSSLPEVDRDKIIPKLQLFAECDAKIETKSGKKYVPEFQRLDVVYCDFTGVGYEWDSGHYAIVWDVSPEFDSIMVIPTTSQQRQTYANVFSVESIPGLNQKKTTLLVSDMTRVSRKRLSEKTWNHPKKGLMRVRLQSGWIARITEAIVVTYGNEITFSDYIMNNYGVAMISDLRTLRELAYRPVKCAFDAATKVLTYRLWNDTTWNSIQLINPSAYIAREDKERLVKGLLSIHPDMRAEAETEFKRLYL